MWTQGNEGSKGRQQGPVLTTMGAQLNQAAQQGFRESFSITNRGLYSVQCSRFYRPEQVRIIKTIRVGPVAGEAQRTTIYFLETSDGLKGTLTLSNRTSDNAAVFFMDQVEEIQRGMQRHDRNLC